MRYFFKRYHKSHAFLYMLLYLIPVFAVFYLCFGDIVRAGVVLVVFGIYYAFALWEARRINEAGMYVYEDAIFYKDIFENKKIDVSTIAGIRIEYSKSYDKHGTSYIKRNGDGEPMYAMVFLKTVDRGSVHRDLAHTRKSDIVCVTVYDADLVKLFKRLRPGINVFRSSELEKAGEKVAI